jgi:predicted esterase
MNLSSSKFLFLFILLLRFNLLSGPQAHQTGRIRLTLSERSPLSSRESFLERGITFSEENDYDANGRFMNLTVPQSYRPDRPIGLLVWISATDGGDVPNAFRSNLETFNLMAVSVVNTGNSHPVFQRLGLALDAVHTLKTLYNIDSERVIISGNSGGGRCASMLAPLFPDVFAGGGYYVIGCNPYRDIRYERDGKRYISNGIDGYNRNKVEQARRNRFVFHTGSDDFNKPGTQRVYQDYLDDGLKHCLYLEDPGLGHSTPPAESIAKGLAFLNAGLADRAVELVAEGLEQARAGRMDLAWESFLKADVYGNPDAAGWMLRMTEAIDRETDEALAVLEEEGMLAGARALQAVVEKYGTQSAKQAGSRLDLLRQDPEWVREQTAAGILQTIQRGHAANGMEKTLEFLQRLVDEYPGTSAAVQAEQALANAAARSVQ